MDAGLLNVLHDAGDVGILAVGDAVDIDLDGVGERSEEHTSELQSLRHLVCRLLLEKKKREKYDQHKKVTRERRLKRCAGGSDRTGTTSEHTRKHAQPMTGTRDLLRLGRHINNGTSS